MKSFTPVPPFHRLIRLLALATAFGLGSLGGVHAQSASQKELPPIERFAFGGTGFAGTVSRGQIEFEKALQAPDAVAQFEHWYAEGTPALRAYALVGLHRLAPERYRQLKAQMLEQGRQRDQYQNMTGCTVIPNTYLSLCQRIEAGHYDAYLKAAFASRPEPRLN